MRNISDIILDVENFKPEHGNWIKLDNLLGELWETGYPERGIDCMLKVFERFPEDDGCEVFWSIVHGLESLNDYEEKLEKSLYRQPSSFGILMLNRMKNSGQHLINGKEIVAIYNDLLNHDKMTDSIRQEIKDYLKEE